MRMVQLPDFLDAEKPPCCRRGRRLSPTAWVRLGRHSENEALYDGRAQRARLRSCQMSGGEAGGIFEAVSQGPVESDMRKSDQRDRQEERRAEREPEAAERQRRDRAV